MCSSLSLEPGKKQPVCKWLPTNGMMNQIFTWEMVVSPNIWPDYSISPTSISLKFPGSGSHLPSKKLQTLGVQGLRGWCWPTFWISLLGGGSSPPIWKICASQNWKSSPKVRGENEKNIWVDLVWIFNKLTSERRIRAVSHHTSSDPLPAVSLISYQTSWIFTFYDSILEKPSPQITPPYEIWSFFTFSIQNSHPPGPFREVDAEIRFCSLGSLMTATHSRGSSLVIPRFISCESRISGACSHFCSHLGPWAFVILVAKKKQTHRRKYRCFLVSFWVRHQKLKPVFGIRKGGFFSKGACLWSNFGELSAGWGGISPTKTYATLGTFTCTS